MTRDHLPVVIRADPLSLDLSGGGVGDDAQILQLREVVLL